MWMVADMVMVTVKDMVILAVMFMLSVIIMAMLMIRIVDAILIMVMISSYSHVAEGQQCPYRHHYLWSLPLVKVVQRHLPWKFITHTSHGAPRIPYLEVVFKEGPVDAELVTKLLVRHCDPCTVQLLVFTQGLK